MNKIFISLLLICYSMLAQAAPTVEELQWRYSQQFLNYTTWPAQEPELKVCLVGETGLRIDDEQTIKTKTGVFTVQRFELLPTIKQLSLCQAVYFSAQLALTDLQFYLAELAQKPVLTIAHHESFLKIGGHIRFILKQNLLRFAISNDNLTLSGLAMHPALLRLSEKSGD